MQFLPPRKMALHGLVWTLMSIAVGSAATGFAQPVVPPPPEKVTISLASQGSVQEILAAQPETKEALVTHAPPNFHFFRTVRNGEVGEAERLVLKFAVGSKLTAIESSPDFKVEQGSSCVEGDTYTAGGTCQLLVRFTPRGPGRRSGKLTIAHTASARPLNVGLSGYGYAPSVSFTPAAITTVPATYVSGAGLISGATNLAVSDGDSLYIADTGNNLVRFLNSSGTFQTVSNAFGFSDPVGIAVDDAGAVYVSEPTPNEVLTSYPYGGSSFFGSYLSGSCTLGQTCSAGSFPIGTLGAIAYDRNGGVFVNGYNILRLTHGTDGLDATPLQPNYDGSGLGPPVNPLAVDSGDNLYTYYQYPYSNGSVCTIASETEYSAANGLDQSRIIAGGLDACGFGGDGGQARNALISANVGQMTFDIAGNLYFSDTGNQRVRRIDGATGIITTIAGNGTAGYTGDGGAGPAATLSSPAGLGVDSQGQVYILSSTTATGTSQVVRKLGPDGVLTFPNQLKGTASVAQTVTMANSGNSNLVLTNTAFTGAAAADFSIDPTTTTCFLAANSGLISGASCKIGILFKPSTTGTRTARLAFLDNTVAGANFVDLSGTGTLPAATFAITSPANGASFVSGTAVTFSVSVTSASGPTPTGTVKFSVGGVAYGNPVTLSGGVASVSVTGLTVGAHTLSATYSGDANYGSSGPLTRSITVTSSAAKGSAKVTLQSKTSPATSCVPLVFFVAVANGTAGELPAGEVPTGKVELMEGKTLRASGTIVKGTVSLTVPALATGTHMLVATYLGDAHHAGATSAALKEVVARGGTCTKPNSGLAGVVAELP
jgi:hypothetical protein